MDSMNEEVLLFTRAINKIKLTRSHLRTLVCTKKITDVEIKTHLNPCWNQDGLMFKDTIYP